MITLGGFASIESYTDSTTPTGATVYNNLRSANFLRPGYYNRSAFYYGGGYGGYWSSTSVSSTSARSLLFNATYVGSIDSRFRMDGFVIRCVLNN